MSNGISLAAYLGELVSAADDFELLAPVELSICCFRYVPPGVKTSDAGAEPVERARHESRANRRPSLPVERNRQRPLRTTRRITNFRTTKSDIELTLETIRDAAKEKKPGTLMFKHELASRLTLRALPALRFSNSTKVHWTSNRRVRTTTMNRSRKRIVLLTS